MSSEPSSGPLSYRMEYAKRINFASAQNSVPVIRELEIHNSSQESLENLTLKLTAHPPFCRDKEWRIDQLSSDDKIEISDNALTLDFEVLAGLNESEKGQIKLTLVQQDRMLTEEAYPIELLARDEWGGISDMSQILAAFVSPNHSTVAKIIKGAAEILSSAGHSSALDGYQSADPSRTYMLAASVWSSITGLGLTYAVPPATFERTGQKVRDPGRIANESLATCLDTSLLFAAALEATGLNPVIVFTQGHSFTGVWLIDKTLPTIVEPDITELRKAIAAREFIVFETTLVTSRPASGFEQAIEAGKAHLTEEKEPEYEQAIDIRRARQASIKPLASHEATARVADSEQEVAAVPLPPPPDFGLLPGEIGEDVIPDEPEGRIQRWQRKLLDLSLRNRLLNFVTSKQTLPLLCTDVPKLEDLLADGVKLRAISLVDENPVGDRDPAVFRQQTGKDIHSSFSNEALDRKQACVPLPGNDMTGRLTTLFRKAKSDLNEGGTNTLFLAAGFLKWKKSPTDKRSYRAPLLLLPISLTRRSAKSDYYFADHEDEPRFNATLLQFLKRDFDLNIPALEGELPEDDSGIDLPKVFEIVRTAVRDVPGFEVVEEAAISTFSFAKFLMWKDLVDRTDQLRNNRLVRHLIDSPETPFIDGESGLPDPSELDRRLAPADLLTPLPADSSQLSAVVAAAEGNDFVIIGPPGTGKSQTIANMIAHCLAKGKSVLFVAEKSAALDVVHRRLKAHGLGDVCLELHSNKADRKRVLEQLGEAWDRATENSDRKWIQLTNELRVHRDHLNAYADALHRPGSHGTSIFAAIGIVVGKESAFELSYANANSHREDALEAIIAAAERAGIAYSHVQFSGKSPFAAIGCQDWSFAWQTELVKRAETLLTTIPPLRERYENLNENLGLQKDSNLVRHNLDSLSGLPGAAATISSADYTAALDPDFREFKPALSDLSAVLAEIDNARSALSISYTDKDTLRMPLQDFERDWREAVVKVWPLSFFAKRRVIKLLETYGEGNRPDPAVDIPHLQTLKTNLERLGVNACSRLPGFNGVNTKIASLETWHANASQFRQQLDRIRPLVTATDQFEKKIASVLPEREINPPILSALNDFSEAQGAFDEALVSYQSHIVGELNTESVLEIEKAVSGTVENKSRLVDWTKWVAARVEANSRGLEPLISALESRVIENDVAAEATRIAYFTWWLPLALDASTELRGFVHWDHGDHINKFRELDEAVQKLVSAQVRQRLSHQLPAKDTVPRRSELGTLRHQIGLQRPSMAIRQLIGEMPDTFNKLTPCVLMSPLSVAQYLPAGHSHFDLVIFDEASQITTWDAVGAIARGEQSIIVGDPKQLPPTNFFGRTEDDDDLEIFEKDLPSILEEAANAGLPRHQLNWHYRSRDETLIAFSNHHYYSGRLVTFPSPKTDSDALTFHKIEGVYARGKGRTNEAEARAIVELATKRMLGWLEFEEEKRLTLGVITFNAQQQELILDLLDAERRTHPDLEWFFEDDREEPTIVKNLENIQGDERDVMLFSITFGPDQSGALTMNFGAINNDGGEKRLNVAVTRARAELHIFSSVTAEKIDLSRTNAIGVAHLKTFLDYAERGPIALPAAEQGSLGPTESPFEDAVVESLTAMGWHVRTQIGVSLFRIDIGVVHPDHAGAYLAGVECDGATYHSSASARDRDKIREAVLRGLGWEIVRIWSTDWFMNPTESALRVDGELKELLANSRNNSGKGSFQTSDPEES